MNDGLKQIEGTAGIDGVDEVTGGGHDNQDYEDAVTDDYGGETDVEINENGVGGSYESSDDPDNQVKASVTVDPTTGEVTAEVSISGCF